MANRNDKNLCGVIMRRSNSSSSSDSNSGLRESDLDGMGYTALHRACTIDWPGTQFNLKKVIEDIISAIEKGVDPNTRFNPGDMELDSHLVINGTPLHFLFHEQNGSVADKIHIAKLLIERGADPEATIDPSLNKNNTCLSCLVGPLRPIDMWRVALEFRLRNLQNIQLKTSKSADRECRLNAELAELMEEKKQYLDAYKELDGFAKEIKNRAATVNTTAPTARFF